MNDDATLLRRYAAEASQNAFAELVHRHVDLVYGAAMRRTDGDAHRAAEVVQQVFTSLARDAGKVSRHTVLVAWLHTATRNAALNLMISDQRRKVRETEALSLESVGPSGTSVPDWEQVRPALDRAIDELAETDRAAVVLRFLEHRPFAEIGAVLKVSEDAARMRTERALEKLRAALARKGITSTASALGTIVLSQPTMAAPVGLAATSITQSLAGASGGLFAATLASFMTAKLITTALLSALIAFGLGAYVGLKRDVSTVTPSIASVASDQSQLVDSLLRDNQRLSGKVSSLNADVGRLNASIAAVSEKRSAPSPMAAPAKSPNIALPLYELQRAVLNNLRQIDSAREQFALENGHPAASIRDLVGVGRYIKTVRTVGGEDYSTLSMLKGQLLTVTTPDGVSVTYDPADTLTTHVDVPPALERALELGKKVQPSAMKAIEAYRSAHNGTSPPNEEAILSFFSSPQEGADYVEFMEARKAAAQ